MEERRTINITKETFDMLQKAKNGKKISDDLLIWKMLLRDR